MFNVHFFKCNIITLILVAFTLFSSSQNSLLTSDAFLTDFYIEKLQIDSKCEHNEIKQHKGNPYQFAIPYQVEFPIRNLAVDNALKGEWHYLLEIEVPNAYALNFTLKGLRGSEVQSIYLKNNVTGELLGQFFPATNKFDLTPFPIIYTNSLLIEIISKQIFDSDDVVVYRVGVTYDKDFLNSSGACEKDVSCFDNELYFELKKSVVRLLIDNIWLCSGTILNNTFENRQPFLLTANHCVGSDELAANTTFFFNYESPYCDADSDEYPMVNKYHISGSTLRATKNDEQGSLDFTLLELDHSIPEDFDVLFAGWIASPKPSSNNICIHHPQGDVKKISLDYDAVVSSTFDDTYDANSHWQIAKWDVGVTEGGSSGSALFNRNKQVIGDLTGGESNCDYPYNDFYTKFSDAFNKYADSSQQLQYWLDPLKLEVYTWESFPRKEDPDEFENFIYPVPSQGYFFICDLPIEKECTVSIYNIEGIFVWSIKVFLENGQVKIKYPKELKGIYFIKIQDAKHFYEQIAIFI